jgi:hypothetical protein
MKIKIVFCLLVLALPAAANEQLPLPLTPSEQESLVSIRKAMPTQTRVSMNVSHTKNFIDVSESSLKIDLVSNKTEARTRFSFHGTIDYEFPTMSTHPNAVDDNPLKGYTLRGYGNDITITPEETGWQLLGWSRHTRIRIMVEPVAEGYKIWGQGAIELKVKRQFTLGSSSSKLTVEGWIDEKRFDKKALAALGACLAVISEPQS